jgi:hypothetical protein
MLFVRITGGNPGDGFGTRQHLNDMENLKKDSFHVLGIELRSS